MTELNNGSCSTAFILFLRFVLVLKIFQHLKDIFKWANKDTFKKVTLKMSLCPYLQMLLFFLKKNCYNLNAYVSDTTLSLGTESQLVQQPSVGSNYYFSVRLTTSLSLPYNLKGATVLTIPHFLRAEKWINLFLKEWPHHSDKKK